MIPDPMNTETAKKIQAIIGKQEEKVTRYTMQKILRFPPNTRIGYVQNDYRSMPATRTRSWTFTSWMSRVCSTG